MPMQDMSGISCMLHYGMTVDYTCIGENCHLLTIPNIPDHGLMTQRDLASEVIRTNKGQDNTRHNGDALTIFKAGTDSS